MSKLANGPSVSRRQIMITMSAAAFAALSLPTGEALASALDVEAAVMKRIGGKTPKSGRIKLELPEIAENGSTVPLTVHVESPMTSGDYVKQVHFFAELNPNPDVATFQFTPRSGKASASTRIRLAKTQNIVAVAEMSDGSVYMNKSQVKVTIGGCGG